MLSLKLLLASHAWSILAPLLLAFISFFFFLLVASSSVTRDETEAQSWGGVEHEIAETVCQWELGRMDEPEL